MAVPNPTQDRHGVSINTELACRFPFAFTNSANRTVIFLTVALPSQLGRGSVADRSLGTTPLTTAGAFAPSFLPKMRQGLPHLQRERCALPREGQEFPSVPPFIIDNL